MVPKSYFTSFLVLVLYALTCCEAATLISKTYTGCTAADDFSINPTSCLLFNRCAYGFTYTYKCPDGTAFDSVQKVCDFVKNVYRCTGQDIATPPPTMLPTTQTTTSSLCKFYPLNQLEKTIFCNSATFKSFYPFCCL